MIVNCFLMKPTEAGKIRYRRVARQLNASSSHKNQRGPAVPKPDRTISSQNAQ